MTSAPKVSEGTGVIVLAAYRPDPDLFAVQLRSIRDQTRGDFRCLVGADGGQAQVRALVAEVVGDDARFEVIGWDDNLGFYLNFERLLVAVPEDATWVALSDQDDHWYPHKLARLVPLLDDAMLATGQALVVTAENSTAVPHVTRRKMVSSADLLIQNQVTGSVSVFRRELLDLALPFPRHGGITELHDHWLAMAATASLGYVVLDEVVQDYVQHGQNVVGEGLSWAAHSRRHFERLTSACRHAGGPHVGLTLRDATIGWRITLLETLAARGQDLHRAGFPDRWLAFDRPRRAALLIAMRGLRSRDVLTRVAVPIVAGAMVQAVSSTRRASKGGSKPIGVHYGSRVAALDAEASPPSPSAASKARAPLHVGRPNLGSRELFDSYVDRIYDTRWLTNDGPLVRELESAIADRVGVRHCIAMCNGTVALEIAIRAAGLTGEVIVPSFTFVATAHALNWQGLTPVFADIDRETHTLDPASVEAAITERTTGIIGVHLWGRSAHVAGLEDVARRHDLTLMFDAAHAFGCATNGVPAGANGRAEVFSFHATKFFNTFEGGAIVTDDDELADRARLMRNFGFSGYDNVIHPGTNGKMPEICAAMGLVNLPEVDRVVAGNEATFALYDEALSGLGKISLLHPGPDETTNYQYVVAIVHDGAKVRDRIVDALHAQGVLARRYFWPGIHRMPQYADLPLRVPLEETEWVSDRVLVLPGGPSLTRSQITVITQAMREVCLG